MTPERIAELRELVKAAIQQNGDDTVGVPMSGRLLLQLLDEAEACNKMRQAVVKLHEQATLLAHIQRGKDDWLCRQHEDEASCYYRAIAAMDEAITSDHLPDPTRCDP